MSGGTTPLDGAAELCRLDARSLAAAYKAGALSPVEVTEAVLARADSLDPALRAFTLIDRDGALRSASASEARWQNGAPLSPADGVPTTLKDIVLVEGWPVRYGSQTTEATPRFTDAPAVARLRAAGAVFVAQTTTPEFGWKAVTDSGLCGVTRNPWSMEMTAGGSSGGAGVAAACGAGVFHLGTDGGGSIRIPASFCGIFGLKPTYARVAAYPASAFGTVAHIGPMTRKAADAEIMLAAMSGRDIRDWTQGPAALPDLEGERTAQLAGLRVGYWTTPPSGRLDSEVARIVDGAVRAVEAHGAHVEPVELPGQDHLGIFHHHWFSGAAARLAAVPLDRHGAVDAGFLAIAEEGASYSARALMLAQELGGKSANILFPDIDLADAVTKGVAGCFGNSGQACNAPTRMLVSREHHDEAAGIARKAAEGFTVGPAMPGDAMLGPVVSQAQYDKIQSLIESGVAEGATLVAGGPGRPSDLNRGYFVRPTVFADVSPDMRIAREEIFGPVLSIMPYDSVDEAIKLANASEYGLAGYVQSGDLAKAREAARRLRAGSVYINYPAWDPGLPFGGYKKSGNGREYAEFGLEDFLETKGIAGYEAT